MDPQDYQAAGFNNFLSRSIDNGQAINLDSQPPIPNKAVAFDRNQMTGSLGDTVAIGKITLNGSTGTIIGNDGDNDFFLLGEE